MSSALCSIFARSCDGLMWPNFPTISAATPETCGAAIDVPAAKKYVDVPAPGLMTKSNTKHGRVIEPLGRSGSVQLSLPGYDASPPGAATLITDCPMLE